MTSTKQELFSLIEDVEIITKELFEVISIPKGSKTPDTPETQELLDLLIHKDAKIQDALKVAKEQGEVQKKMDAIQAEVDKRDHEMNRLQKNLKEAENMLATAIYQAKQKLHSMAQAKAKAISSEDLIRYAHKISASNAVAAPTTWTPGDPRRPYPTDVEMRMGFLGQMSNLPSENLTNHVHGNFSDTLSASRGVGQLDHMTSQSSGLTWQQQPHISMETSMTMGAQKGQNKENEVGIMSSDSSSSSSSDDE
ncbi:unnamed protein product [Owenia fusiformis]|uniref:Mediator of RNA polymerase II transcription subunit 4 n=1 Tax=Owenia fusiformis TaxID=6347 RepID=A0A8J1Y083_OWEFU|nr:unnamed protein product [Owenia fusiformis]